MSLMQMSIMGAVMIAVICMLRIIFVYRLPKNTFLILWGLAGMRLLIPIAPRSAISVYSLKTIGVLSELGQNEAVSVRAVSPATVGGGAQGNFPVGIFTILWIAGMIFCAAFFLTLYMRYIRKFKTAADVKNSFIQQWHTDHPCARTIRVRQSDKLRAPLTYGLFRPNIIMPGTADWKDTQCVFYVLEHEYVHIKRCDAAMKFLLAAVLCVHWFNPFVWIMYILANKDIELSCDEQVIKHIGIHERADYARVLIHMEEIKSGFVPFCSGFGKNAIEERIKAMIKMKKTKITGFVLAAVLVMGTAGVFATTAAADKVTTIFTPSVAREVILKTVEKDGTVFLPLRMTVQRMGCTISWDNEKQMAVIDYHGYDRDITISCTADSTVYTKNGQPVQLKEAPFFMELDGNDSIYVPETFFSELLEVILVLQQ